jgi:hypothetical protein
MCSVGWIIFYPCLYMIDPLYIKWGSSIALRNSNERVR